MTIRDCTLDDFEIAYDIIVKLWDYNTYDKEVIRRVWSDVLAGENDFAFFVEDEGEIRGFCHGTFFNTFWLSGMSCYVSSIYTNPDFRKKGYGRAMLDHVQGLAKARGCSTMFLDSGNSRLEAHKFYEIYGFNRHALCFDYELK
jgi:GNAT superfamily N-acetyltransferase